MQIPKNKFRKLIEKDQPTYGIWNGLPGAYAAEICAGAGFDWVVIDNEHAPFNLQSTLHQMQAMAAFDVPIMVRPPSGDAVLIKQLLDVGVETLIIPMVDTAEEAAELVRAIHYPPKGIRGVGYGLSRASQWGRIKDYFDQADVEICLILQVETVKGIENLEAILKVDGVDGVFIGPADLAASMGMLGQSNHPRVVAQVSEALQKISDAGKVTGVLSFRKDIVEHYVGEGANMIAVAADSMLLAKASSDLAASYK